MKYLIQVSVILSFFIVSLYAQNNEIQVEKDINWRAKEIRFTLSVAIDQERLPSSRQRAEGLIEREKSRLIAQSLRDVILDSQGTFHESLLRRNSLQWNLDAAASLAQREYATLTADLTALEVVYRLEFHHIMQNIRVETMQRVAPLMTPNQREFNYSGIVIFVASSLPVHGQFNQRSALEPALAPMIMDENGVTLLNLATINPSIFESSAGGIEYSMDRYSKSWSPLKVGFNPLVISAVAVAGDNHKTDIVISVRDADRLRSSPEALAMLQRAQVLIVLDQP
ncbi:hypothetical protein PVA45_01950 [Entomospira entomophila]|uniref:Uncharacterized protein n=1 Tax=Entomospira entomophila TaxID=2719988 RepID=A0A968KTG1_9SPIO|nr:hypothetical protein [Entomospira entomophilus]NIZ40276.1 hypothetical protein [Entomospira entomophilus]WDI35835.1 hypothetical protein PVA45_01950 [Entomospira entomophilus]